MIRCCLRQVWCAVLWSAAFALANEPEKAPADNTFMIVDLRGELPGLFQYGSWNGKLSQMKSGMAVLGNKGAQGDGGFGQELGKPLDFEAVEYVEVALGVVPGNEVPEVTLALNDADGTQFTARIPIEALVPGTPVWLRAPRSAFRLNGIEAGKDSKMNWREVTRWHVQGDWTTKKPLRVIFVALRARRH